MRERSLTPLTPLGSPVLSPQVKRKRPKPSFPELSPSPSPPPPPPLPRRKPHDPPQQSASASTSTGKTLHPPRAGYRDSSSSDVQIIERPASFVEGHKQKVKDRGGERVKVEKKKEGKEGKKKGRASEAAAVIEIDSDNETLVRPSKRRKTLGSMPSGSQRSLSQAQTKTQSQTQTQTQGQTQGQGQNGVSPVGRPRKDHGQNQTQSQSQSQSQNQSQGKSKKGKGKEKQVERFTDSSPEPAPVSVAAPAPQTKAKVLADDVDCEWPAFIEGDTAYQREVSLRAFPSLSRANGADTWRERQYVNCDK